MITSTRTARRATSSFSLSAIALAAIALTLSACGGGSSDTSATAAPAPLPPLANQLYAETNETANAVVHLSRNADGGISVKNRTATGGMGLDGVKPGAAKPGPDSLVSQNSVIVSADKTLLFAVNGGDASISVFSIDQSSGDLTLKKVTKTLGTTPSSLAFRNGFLYVSYQTGSDQLGTYALQADGSLTQLGLYHLPTVAAATPTQLVVSPDANFVVVSAGTASNALLSYPMNKDGTLGAPLSNAANTPFAGVFASPTVYLTTDIGAKGLSSYSVSNAGALSLISSAMGGEAGPCWLALTPNGKYAYVGNAAGSISSYMVDASGGLTLLNAKAAQEAGVIAGVPSVSGDSWISADGKFLYSDYLGDDKIVAYSINPDGSISKINEQIIGTSSSLSLQGLTGI